MSAALTIYEQAVAAFDNFFFDPAQRPPVRFDIEGHCIVVQHLCMYNADTKDVYVFFDLMCDGQLVVVTAEEDEVIRVAVESDCFRSDEFRDTMAAALTRHIAHVVVQ